MKVNFLGELPLDPEVRIGGDTGHPVATLGPDDKRSKGFYRSGRSRLDPCAGKWRAVRPDYDDF